MVAEQVMQANYLAKRWVQHRSRYSPEKAMLAELSMPLKTGRLALLGTPCE